MKISSNIIAPTYTAQRLNTNSITHIKNNSIEKEKTDFTNMTRQEMREWINSQLHSGKMTFEESSPFVGLTAKISEIDGKEVPAESDFSKINFIQEAKDAFAYALSHNNEDTAKWLASAISIMSREKA